MGYGDVLNDLSISKSYFNELLYIDIMSKTIFKSKKNNDTNILTYYKKRKGQKKLYLLLKKQMCKGIIFTFWVNFYLEKLYK
tara:strand:- start:2556 stop:2801 length:246 start_codon:yes stop_codon:yes gene_type:complete